MAEKSLFRNFTQTPILVYLPQFTWCGEQTSYDKEGSLDALLQVQSEARWRPHLHHVFPAKVREAVRALLLTLHRLAVPLNGDLRRLLASYVALPAVQRLRKVDFSKPPNALRVLPGALGSFQASAGQTLWIRLADGRVYRFRKRWFSSGMQITPSGVTVTPSRLGSLVWSGASTACCQMVCAPLFAAHVRCQVGAEHSSVPFGWMYAGLISCGQTGLRRTLSSVLLNQVVSMFPPHGRRGSVVRWMLSSQLSHMLLSYVLVMLTLPLESWRTRLVAGSGPSLLTGAWDSLNVSIIGYVALRVAYLVPHGVAEWIGWPARTLRSAVLVSMAQLLCYPLDSLRRWQMVHGGSMAGAWTALSSGPGVFAGALASVAKSVLGVYVMGAFYWWLDRAKTMKPLRTDQVGEEMQQKQKTSNK